MLKDEIKIGEVLRSYYQKRGFTQSSLANKLEIRKSTLHSYFYGTVPKGVYSLIKIANYFEISLDELIFGEKHQSAIQIEPSHLLEGRYEIVIQRKIKELRYE